MPDDYARRYAAAYDALVEQGFALASERERTVDTARSAYEAAISPRR